MLVEPGDAPEEGLLAVAAVAAVRRGRVGDEAVVGRLAEVAAPEDELAEA